MKNVSVCMATYNGGDFILEQVSSILPQLGPCDELIISDDSSDDDTIALIRSLDDHRIRILAYQRFRSPIYNFEHAIKAAEGKYIFLADQDDVWVPGKVTKCTALLEEGYDLVVTNCKVVDKELNTLHPSFFEVNNSGKGFLRNLIKNSYLGCCICFKKEMRQLFIPFPRDIPMHDIWIGFVAEMTGRIKFENEQLILYRRHGKNETSSGGKSHYSFIQKLMFRWNLLKYLPLVLLRRYKYKQ